MSRSLMECNPQASTFNGVVYPSTDPSIFEIKLQDTDIRGRVLGDL